MVPWKRVASWHCSACGKCCKEYRVRLTFYEYLKLKNTGFVEERNGKYFIKKIGNKCPFQIGNLCYLQGKNKPVACKLYPFIIRKKGEDLAYYEYKNEIFYVYVDLGCPNVKIGEGKGIEKFVKEAIEIYLSTTRIPTLLTNPTSFFIY